MKKNQKSSRLIRDKNQKFLNFAFLILNFTFVTVASAAEEAGEHAFTWKDWFWPIINFSILAFLLIKFLARPAREFFKKRTEMIEKTIKDAEETKELARKALAEVNDRLKNTSIEVNEILESARKAGEKEKKAIIAEGERMKNKMLEQTKAGIEFELQKAKESIKSDAAVLALELAEKQIKDRLGKKEHESLIDEYIKKLEVKR